MIWGLLLSLARWRNYLPVYLVFGFHTAVHLLSWPAPPYRLPADAMLMSLAGLAVLDLVRRISEWRRSQVSAEKSADPGSTFTAEGQQPGISTEYTSD
jgi:hypothetical protein